jgi:transcriptional regulator with XRE-family HTH domain
MAMNLVKRLRQERGWLQLDLARKVGVSEVAISKIETGRTQPGPVLTAQLASCFGVSADDLARGVILELDSSSSR